MFVGDPCGPAVWQRGCFPDRSLSSDLARPSYFLREEMDRQHFLPMWISRVFEIFVRISLPSFMVMISLRCLLERGARLTRLGICLFIEQTGENGGVL